MFTEKFSRLFAGHHFETKTFLGKVIGRSLTPFSTDRLLSS